MILDGGFQKGLATALGAGYTVDMTEQQMLNKKHNANNKPTAYTEQVAYNLARGYKPTQYSLQEAMHIKAAATAANGFTAADFSPHTKYTVDQLIALHNASKCNLFS